MLGAGLLAKKAVERGLTVPAYVKTSLSPGSGVVTYYLRESGVIPYLERLGFGIVGYGCMTCIGNSGPIEDTVSEVRLSPIWAQLAPLLLANSASLSLLDCQSNHS